MIYLASCLSKKKIVTLISYMFKCGRRNITKNTCTYITACGIPRTHLGVTPASEEVGTDSWVVRALAFVDWKEIGQISLARFVDEPIYTGYHIVYAATQHMC